MAVKKRSPAPLLARLRGAIRSVKFLLSFDATTWLASALGRSPSPPRRLVSFKARPSLLDCGAEESFFDAGSSFSLSRTSSSFSPASTAISRTVSDASYGGGDDINQRAESFIDKFYQQLQMERQVSLELNYCREKSLERTVSDY